MKFPARGYCGDREQLLQKSGGSRTDTRNGTT